MAAQDNFFKKALLLGLAGATTLGGLAMGSKALRESPQRSAAIVIDQSQAYWKQLQMARKSLKSAEDGVFLKITPRAKADLMRVAASETDRFVHLVTGKYVDPEHIMLVVSDIDGLFSATANHLGPESMNRTAASRRNLQRDRGVLAAQIR